jgi:hypothetical protein
MQPYYFVLTSFFHNWFLQYGTRQMDTTQEKDIQPP